MKRLLTIFFLLANGACFGQNLVPNGNFEQYNGCPTASGQLDSVLFWMNPANTLSAGSPDYFNQCGAADVMVPQNNFGFQQAHSGNGYVGINTYYHSLVPDYREFIETPLTSALRPNSCYHISFYINLSNSSKLTSDAIGVYFSDTALTGVNNFSPFLFTPQVNNAIGNTPDTLDWTLVEGNYTAAGGERFLVIGNFKDDAQTNTTLVNNSGWVQRVYLYIDDVSLTSCDSLLSISNPNQNDGLVIYPTVFSDNLNIKAIKEAKLEFYLYNIESKKLLQQEFAGSTTLNVSHLAPGIYFYEVRKENGTIAKGKVIKQ